MECMGPGFLYEQINKIITYIKSKYIDISWVM